LNEIIREVEEYFILLDSARRMKRETFDMKRKFEGSLSSSGHGKKSLKKSRQHFAA